MKTFDVDMKNSTIDDVVLDAPVKLHRESLTVREDFRGSASESQMNSSAQQWQSQEGIWRTSYQLQAAAEAEAEIAGAAQAPELKSEEEKDATADAERGEPHKRTVQPLSATAFLAADVAARMFCLTIFWVVLVLAVLCSNAALCAVLLTRAQLSLDAALAALVAFDLLLAVLCVAFMARRVKTDIFSWLSSSLFHRPKMVNIEARASLLERLDGMEAQLQPVMQKAKKAFDKAENKLMKKAAEAAQLMREDTPASVVSEPRTEALQRAAASQGASSSVDIMSDTGTPTLSKRQRHGRRAHRPEARQQGLLMYVRQARKAARVFGKMAKGKGNLQRSSGARKSFARDSPAGHDAV